MLTGERGKGEKKKFFFVFFFFNSKDALDIFFLFYMDSKERRTPVKVETIRAKFLCSCFIERDLVSCSSLRHKHTPSILQAVSNLFR